MKASNLLIEETFHAMLCILCQSYCVLQLYNEEVHDLLARNTNTKLQIHESKESGVYVAGLREDIVTSAENVIRIIDEGEGSRHFGETRMNKQSSRSHTVFRMVSCQDP